MDGSEVALASLAIMATMVGALVWIVKKQFISQETTIKQNTEALENNNEAYGKLSDLIDGMLNKLNVQDERDQKVLDILDKISSKQDCIYDTITTTNMNVETLVVNHLDKSRTVKCKGTK